MAWKIEYTTVITVVSALLDALENYIEKSAMVEANVIAKDIYIIMSTFAYNSNDPNFPIEYKIITIALWDRLIQLNDLIILMEFDSLQKPVKFSNPFGVN